MGPINSSTADPAGLEERQWPSHKASYHQVKSADGDVIPRDISEYLENGASSDMGQGQTVLDGGGMVLTNGVQFMVLLVSSAKWGPLNLDPRILKISVKVKIKSGA